MRDLKRAYGNCPARFEESVERALREKEGRKVIHGRKKWTILLIAALTVALLAGMGYAAVRSGLIDVLRESRIEPAEGAEEVIARDLGTAEAGDITISVTEAAYAGMTLDVMIEFTSSTGKVTVDPSCDISSPDTVFDGVSTSVWSEDGARMVWLNVILAEDAPNHLVVDLVVALGMKSFPISFTIDKSQAQEATLLSDKVVSDDGTLTVYRATATRSAFSQVVSVCFDYNVPGKKMGYNLEMLDADGNVIETRCGWGVGAETLPDGTEARVQQMILSPDVEIAGVRLYGHIIDEWFGTVEFPTN